MPKKPPIPDVPRTPDAGRYRFDQAVKENLELLTGRRNDSIAPLPDNATLGDLIIKINAIIARLQ